MSKSHKTWRDHYRPIIAEIIADCAMNQLLPNEMRKRLRHWPGRIPRPMAAHRITTVSGATRSMCNWARSGSISPARKMLKTLTNKSYYDMQIICDYACGAVVRITLETEDDIKGLRNLMNLLAIDPVSETLQERDIKVLTTLTSFLNRQLL